MGNNAWSNWVESKTKQIQDWSDETSEKLEKKTESLNDNLQSVSENFATKSENAPKTLDNKMKKSKFFSMFTPEELDAAVKTLGALSPDGDKWLDAKDGKVSRSYLAEQYPDFLDFMFSLKKSFNAQLQELTIDEIQELHDKNMLRKHFYDMGYIDLEYVPMDNAISNILIWDKDTDYVFINNDSSNRFFREDIVSFEVIKDGETSQRFGVGSAVGGAILTGGIGVLAGFMMPKKKSLVTDLRLRILTTGEKSVHDIYLITEPTKTNSRDYEMANNAVEAITEFLQNYLINKDSASSTKIESTSVLDEIKKLADLHDSGAITDSEFQSLKEKILNN